MEGVQGTVALEALVAVTSEGLAGLGAQVVVVLEALGAALEAVELVRDALLGSCWRHGCWWWQDGRQLGWTGCRYGSGWRRTRWTR